MSNCVLNSCLLLKRVQKSGIKKKETFCYAHEQANVLNDEDHSAFSVPCFIFFILFIRGQAAKPTRSVASFPRVNFSSHVKVPGAV